MHRVHTEVGAPAALGAPETVMVKVGEVVLAALFPLCAKVRRRAAAWLAGPVDEEPGSEGIGVESETRAVNVKTPAVVGVPVMAPVVVLEMVSPGGSAPVKMTYA